MPNLISTPNPFEFHTHQVRTATDDNGNVWFCAKDVFQSLGIVWKNRAGTLKNTPEKWIAPLITSGVNDGKETIFISEPAVYQATFRSNKPEAIAFTEWVCEEVLPAIRKQGYYGTLSAGQQIALRTQKIKLLEKLATKDAFVYQSVLTSLRNVCNLLGEPMPSVELIGKDRKQLSLEV